MIQSSVNKILNVYSESNLRVLFNQHLLSKKQVSVDFFSNKIKMQQLEDEYVNKNLAFRDACIDPIDSNNQNIIKNHYIYLNDQMDRSNAQIRGIQCDLAGRIFRDCSLAGNMIHTTTLSALDFSNNIQLNLNEVTSSPNVNIPVFFSKANPFSFKQGLELGHAKVISAVYGQEVTITNDSLVKLPRGLNSKNNLPHDQNKADYYRIIGNNAVFEDIKDRALNLIMSQRVPEPGSYFPGTLSNLEESQSSKLLVSKSKNDLYNNPKTKIHNICKEKDSVREKIAILNSVQTNSDIKEQKELIGLASIFSNKFNKLLNYLPVKKSNNDDNDPTNT
jgi:hypothetical protein